MTTYDPIDEFSTNAREATASELFRHPGRMVWPSPWTYRDMTSGWSLTHPDTDHGVLRVGHRGTLHTVSAGADVLYEGESIEEAHAALMKAVEAGCGCNHSDE